MQVVHYLTINQDKEYSFRALKRGLKKHGYSFTDSTLSRSLKVLSERDVITWDRAPDLQYDKKSSIKLKLENIDRKLNIVELVKVGFSEVFEVQASVEDMSEEAIAYKLIDVAKEQAGGSIYVKLRYAQGAFSEDQLNTLLDLNKQRSDLIQEVCIEEVKWRGKKSVSDVIHHFLQSGIEVE